jgi:hypothetical protein
MTGTNPQTTKRKLHSNGYPGRMFDMPTLPLQSVRFCLLRWEHADPIHQRRPSCAARRWLTPRVSRPPGPPVPTAVMISITSRSSRRSRSARRPDAARPGPRRRRWRRLLPTTHLLPPDRKSLGRPKENHPCRAVTSPSLVLLYVPPPPSQPSCATHLMHAGSSFGRPDRGAACTPFGWV